MASGVVGSILLSAAVSTAATLIQSAFVDDEEVEGPRSPIGPGVQTGTEGSPLAYCLGPKNRVSGTVIFHPELTEETDTHTEGGASFAGDVETTLYSYLADFAVAICEGPITAIQKVWANGQVIFTPLTTVEVNDDTHELVASDLGIIYLLFQSPGRMKITAPSGGPDLTVFTPGTLVTVDGYTNDDNNGIFLCTNAWATESGGTAIRLRNALAANESPGAAHGVTLSAVVGDWAPHMADAAPIFLGTLDQIESTMMQGHTEIYPANKVPAYRGIAYVAFTALKLANYGNRIPQLQFLVQQETTLSVADAISAILVRGGLSTDEFDVSGLTGNISGITFKTPTSLLQQLQPILRAFDILTRDSGTQLVFFHRDGGEDSHTLDEDELAAHEAGEETPRPISIQDTNTHSLPQEVTVAYLENGVGGDYDLEQGMQRERRVVSDGTNVIKRITIPVAMTPGQARTIASRELWRAWIHRQRVTLFLPPTYMRIEENDLLSVEIDTVDYVILVQEVNRGHNFIMEVAGLIEHGDRDTTAPAEDSPYPPAGEDDLLIPTPLAATALDIPAMTSSQASVPGILFAACRTDIGSPWQRADFWTSEDDVTFVNSRPLTAESKIGVTETLLGGSARWGVWDRVNTVDVNVLSGTLSSATEIAVLNGANRCIVGDEVIAFQTATLQGDGTYRLSTLLRGLRDTEDDIDGHVINERFVMLDQGSSFGFFEMDASAIGTTWYWKVVSPGDDEADVDSTTTVPTARTMKPFKPAHARTTRTQSNIIKIDWTRVTRDLFRELSLSVSVPLLEPYELYEIDILDAPGGNVLRTATINQSTTFIYSVLAQIHDGITVGDPVDFVIYQMSATVGRGRGLVGVSV